MRMRRLPLTAVAVSLSLASLAAGRAGHAQYYSQDPNTIAYAGAPPPQTFYLHEGPYVQLRGGAGIAVRSQYGGVGFGPLFDVGAGFTSRVGLSVGVNLGMRYAGTAAFGLFDMWVGPQLRYAALQQRSFVHPFGEFGFFFHLPIDTHNPGPPTTMDPALRFQIGYGAQLGGGVSFDLTPNVSFDLGVRLDLFTNAAQNVGTLYFAATPYLGLMFYR